MKLQSLSIFVLVLIAFSACQQEVNFETNIPSQGSLQDEVSGNCLPKTVNGTYKAGNALNVASHTISVQVKVTQTGTYTITTDTLNGYSFKSTGTFSAPGMTNVILRASGTPLAPGTNNFKVRYDTSLCNVAVTVEAGTTTSAVFTLAGAGGSCTGATVNGSYATGNNLNNSNTVTLAVNVTTAGSYNVTTTYQGMTFTGAGIFATTGPGTIALVGSGMPTTAGANTVPVTVGASSCSFVVNVGSPAVFTLDCSAATVNGTYATGTLLAAGNTIVIPVNVGTAGAYSISTTSVNGMIFSGSGNLTTGSGTITLTGSGTPVNPGVSSIPVSFGASSCSVDVTVTGAAVVNWRFTMGTTTYQGSQNSATMMPVAGFLGFYFDGGVIPADKLLFSLGDFSGAINAGEAYSTATTTSNSADFEFLPAGATDPYEANPTTTGATITITVTAHNTTTKTITGTFSGNVKNSAGTIVPVTGGTFTATYP